MSASGLRRRLVNRAHRAYRRRTVSRLLRLPQSKCAPAVTAPITASPARQQVQVRRRPFLDRYVFPDGEETGSGRIITEIQDAGLEVLHEENIRHHYEMTLRDWCATWWRIGTKPSPRSSGYCQVWGLYLAGSRLGFEHNVVQLHQVLATKLDDDGIDTALPLRQWWRP